VVREAGKRLNERTLFGSDYPFIDLDRWFKEFDALGYDDDAKENILHRNAERLLGL
jgi:predicted TIM-barrel fold metal-dependent hydrolase